MTCLEWKPVGTLVLYFMKSMDKLLFDVNRGLHFVESLGHILYTAWFFYNYLNFGFLYAWRYRFVFSPLVAYFDLYASMGFNRMGLLFFWNFFFFICWSNNVSLMLVEKNWFYYLVLWSTGMYVVSQKLVHDCCTNSVSVS